MSAEDERAVIELLRQRTELQREVRALLDQIHQITARLHSVLGEGWVANE